jgi:hypothetical protein
MEAEANIHNTLDEGYKVKEMRLGANWFLWVSIASVVHSLIRFFFATPGMSFGLGMNHYIDNNVTFAGLEPRNVGGLLINLGIAGIFAGFGYLARRGNDAAFIIGMFLYVFDLIVVLGYSDYWGAGIHFVVLFFLFKGLLASRRRYDPSVDATGA